MSNYKIGRVVGVCGDKIEITLLDHDETNQENSGVPQCMSINVNTENGPQPILIGQPGSFLKIDLPTGQLLCMIIDIHMTEVSTNNSEVREIIRSGDCVLENPKRILSVIPFGTISPNGNFEKGTDILPTVNSNVYAVLNETIDGIYSSYAEGNFKIGKLSLFPGQDAKINLDAFLTRHGAILGQTGSGKSWAVASFLQKIAELEKSTVVLFDLHGEYKSAFGDYAEYIDASDLEFPYWLMNCEELVNLMVDRSEAAAPNQIAKFIDLLGKAKNLHPENISLGITDINVDTPVYFDLESIISEFKRLDTEMVPGSKGPRQGDLFGKFSRLLMRLNSKLRDTRYNLIFKPQIYNTSASMTDLFKKLLGEMEETKKIVIIDMSPIPFDVRTSVISLIMRCLFDFAYWYKRLNYKAYPIAVFCDEAHIYLNEYDVACKTSREAAEKIAKEGRKYGISLTVISQRPREVSATILSQCNTFLCLRMTNPDDQSYVRRLLPDSVAGVANMFSVLRRGESILLGDSVIMPTRIKIDIPDPKPTSEDCSFLEEWSLPHEEINVQGVLDAWRNQSINSQ